VGDLELFLNDKRVRRNARMGECYNALIRLTTATLRHREGLYALLREWLNKEMIE